MVTVAHKVTISWLSLVELHPFEVPLCSPVVLGTDIKVDESIYLLKL